jgi:hypothetical protein
MPLTRAFTCIDSVVERGDSYRRNELQRVDDLEMFGLWKSRNSAEGMIVTDGDAPVVMASTC